MPVTPDDFRPLHDAQAVYAAARAAIGAKLTDNAVTLSTNPDGTVTGWVRRGAKVYELPVIDLRGHP